MEGCQFSDVANACNRLAGRIHHTGVVTGRSLDSLFGMKLVFKPENLQKTGSFKFRGALSTVMALLEKGSLPAVVTHSAGNHGAALACAAGLFGVACHVVSPETAPEVKKQAIAGYGANLVLCRPTLPDRESTCEFVQKETGAVFVPPYDHPLIIAGQGTVAMELLEDVPDLDAIVVPVGGGGLGSGVCLAAHGTRPRIRVYGVEPAMADDGMRSLLAGHILPSEYPDTVADGLRTSLGTLPFAILRNHLAEMFTVTEGEILQAMRWVFSRLKLVVEPSAVVGLAALWKHRDQFAGQKVAVVLSGGNVDPDRLGNFF